MTKKTKIISLLVLLLSTVGVFVFFGVDGTLSQGFLKPAYNYYRCYDSDGGKTFETKGVVYGSVGNTRKTPTVKSDYCKNDQLVEYFCENNSIKSTIASCLDGEKCDDGACVKEAYCNESDGGKDYFNNGTTYSNTEPSGKGDSCFSKQSVTYGNQDFVKENFCDGAELKALDVLCPDGCEEGACVKNSEPSIISGFVKDSNGKPLGNADVEAMDQYTVCPGGYTNCWIIRSPIHKMQTDDDGYFLFLVYPEKTYFLEFQKSGYLDSFVYDYDEEPKLVKEGETWEVEAVMKPQGNHLVISDGRFDVKYYPGQESCAEIAMDKMKKFYPQIVGLLGLEPESPTTTFTYLPYAQVPGGNWIGSFKGIKTVCFPWTDNMDQWSVVGMWDENVPHELTHHLTWGYVAKYFEEWDFWQGFVPNWFEEGVATYSSNIVNDIFDCVPGEYLYFGDLFGVNMPKYNTAACALKNLEDQKPGFLHDLLLFLNDQGETDVIYKGCVGLNGYFIKGTLSEVFGEDLTNYFVDNFFFDKAELEKEYNECVEKL